MIDKEPDIPPPILKAIENRGLSIFIGAGASQVIGCWSWEKLATELIEKCCKKECINYRQRQILSGSNDYKKIITICRSILEEKGLKKDFLETIVAGCRGERKKKKKANIYQELIRIPALYVTTNFDENFDEWFHADRVVFREEGFRPELVIDEKLYHIHGSIKDYDTLVLTVPEYIKRYRFEHFRNFMRRIFSEKVILFIGYGMAEYEILDFLITTLEVERQKEARFILLPYYKGYEDIVDFDQHYFGEMGVIVVPYEYDDKGYEQLFDVIKSWNNKIESVSPYPYKKMREIDEVVDTPW